MLLELRLNKTTIYCSIFFFFDSHQYNLEINIPLRNNDLRANDQARTCSKINNRLIHGFLWKRRTYMYSVIEGIKV